MSLNTPSLMHTFSCNPSTFRVVCTISLRALDTNCLSSSHLRPSIQRTQIRLPECRKYSREHESVLRHNKGKTDRSQCRPKLCRIDNADGNRFFNSCDDTGDGFARQSSLHSKPPCVKDGCEYRLLNTHFREYRQPFRAVIEAVPEEDEPAQF